MIFNSFAFLLFFAVVYGVYLRLAHRGQNIWLLLASCFFYGFWDWRFLLLLFFSIWVAYACGAGIISTEDRGRKKAIFLVGLVVKLAILGFFKYFNFFAENCHALLQLFGLHVPLAHLNIILPLGISFYTFQTISYLFDAYRGEIKVSPRFSDFALFAFFFPQLVAGPIERARHLLPQMEKPRTITGEDIACGLYMILWGYFLKVFGADNLAQIANPVFDSQGPYNGIQALLAIYAFTFQIYCDFAGYSSIACGLARLMGFRLMDNFYLPFFVTNIRDFWRRWHISLMSWFKDYLYIPLGGNRGGTARKCLNLFIVFLLSGLWHGASWNFVFFGMYHGVLMVLYLLITGPDRARIDEGRSRKIVFWAKVIVMFHVTALGFMLFRAQTTAQIADLLSAMAMRFTMDGGFSLFKALKMMAALGGTLWLIVVVEYIQFRKQDLRAVVRLPWFWQGLVYCLLIFMLLTFGVGGGQEFIYFQF